MKNKKMIVVDLDGTLLTMNKECTEKTKKYLKRLKELGYIIVIATGRVIRSAFSVTDGAEFANYIIGCSGAVVYDRDNNKVVMKKNIELDFVKNMCTQFNDEMICMNLSDLFYHYKYMNSENLNYAFERRIGNIDIFLRNCDDIYNVTVHLRGNDLIDKYYELFKNRNLDILVMQDSFSESQCLEIFSKGVSKYNAIKVIMDKEGISNKDVIAFGDGLNDVDMIKLSGIGVAMGNALDEVKTVSNYVTISHNRDGVVYFLNKYLKENDLIN